MNILTLASFKIWGMGGVWGMEGVPSKGTYWVERWVGGWCVMLLWCVAGRLVNGWVELLVAMWVDGCVGGVR